MKRLRLLLIVALVASLALSFVAGCTLVGPASGGLDTIQEAWNVIQRDYVERDKVDSAALSQAAIRAMVEALHDPYSAYLEPRDYQLSKSGLAGKFEGIGAHVASREGQITLIPIADLPAARAGIRAGDVVLAVDGQSTENMTLAELVLKVRGPKGTTVRLQVLHPGETTPVTIEVVRAEIEVPSVRFEMRGDIALITIVQFSDRTNQELAPVFEAMTRDGARGIVLDLRSNPGGLLPTVVDVASRFLKEGVVLTVVSNQGKRTVEDVSHQEATTDLPMVVLTDNYSASGSEVLAGALQYHKRAVIAGARTFGKGSVNILRELGDGSGIYITTARWLTPNGRPIEGKGIDPDYPLNLEGEDAINWAIDFLHRGLPRSGRPSQLVTVG